MNNDHIEPTKENLSAAEKRAAEKQHHYIACLVIKADDRQQGEMQLTERLNEWFISQRFAQNGDGSYPLGTLLYWRILPSKLDAPAT